MIKEFVDKFIDQKAAVKASITTHPEDYKELVKRVVEIVSDKDEYDSMDPERIHTINDGDYQGTLVFVIGSRDYQPSKYWYVKVFYGSCSGCDTLQNIRGYGDYEEPPTEQQVEDYWILMLHIVQNLKLMGDSE